MDLGLTVYVVPSTSVPGNGWPFPTRAQDSSTLPLRALKGIASHVFTPSSVLSLLVLATVGSARTQVYLGGCRVRQESCLANPREGSHLGLEPELVGGVEDRRSQLPGTLGIKGQ